MYNMEPESWPYFNIVEQRALAGGLKGHPACREMARDIDQAPVFLAKSSWETGYMTERFAKVAFTKTKERGLIRCSLPLFCRARMMQRTP